MDTDLNANDAPSQVFDRWQWVEDKGDPLPPENLPPAGWSRMTVREWPSGLRRLHLQWERAAGSSKYFEFSPAAEYALDCRVPPSRLYFPGLHNHLSWCGISVQGTTVTVVERRDNPGNAITARVEHVAPAVCQALQVPLSELRWIEESEYTRDPRRWQVFFRKDGDGLTVTGWRLIAPEIELAQLPPSVVGA